MKDDILRLGIDVSVLAPPALAVGHGISFGRATQPNCFIIGGQKCGSTSLARHLNDHPDIFIPPAKEIFYYSHDFHHKRGAKWYQKFFQKGASINVDASVNYFETSYVPQRIAREIPDAKLLLILRNPIERAYSQYQMSVRLGYEHLDFEKAISMEPDRLALGEKLLVEVGHNYFLQRLGYLTKGYYASFLRKWLDHFPREQIYIIESESFFNNQIQMIRDVFQFLNVCPSAMANTYHEKAARYPKMSTVTSFKLEAHFRDKNEELFRLIGQRFTW